MQPKRLHSNDFINNSIHVSKDSSLSPKYQSRIVVVTNSFQYRTFTAAKEHITKQNKKGYNFPLLLLFDLQFSTALGSLMQLDTVFSLLIHFRKSWDFLCHGRKCYTFIFAPNCLQNSNSKMYVLFQNHTQRDKTPTQYLYYNVRPSSKEKARNKEVSSSPVVQS